MTTAINTMVFDGCRVGLMRNLEVEEADVFFVAARHAPAWCHFLLTSQLFWGFLRILLLESQLF